MAPPLTSTHAGDSPETFTDSSRKSPNSTVPELSSRRVTYRTDGSSRIRSASRSLMGGLRRHGLFSSEPSDTVTPAWKKRHTRKVRGAIDSKTPATLLLIPLTMAAINITTVTPIATPRIVSAARTLLLRSESRAMPTPSNRPVNPPPVTSRLAARRWGRGGPHDSPGRRRRRSRPPHRGRRRPRWTMARPLPAAADRLGLRHRFPHVGLRVGLDGQGVNDPRRIDVTPERSARGRNHELVEREPEQVALLLDHADHPVGDVEELHLCAERILAFEQLVGEVVSQHEDRNPGLHLLRRERAALLDHERADVEVQLRRGRDLDVFGLPAARGEGPARVRLPRRHHRNGHAARDRLGILVGHARPARPRPPGRVGDVAELHIGE